MKRLEFEVRHGKWGVNPSFRVLMPDSEVKDFTAPSGPGVWYKIMQQILNAIPGSTPEIFIDDRASDPYHWLRFYYDSNPEALRGNQELMNEYGKFECQQCHSIFPKWEFKYHDICDNCRWENNNWNSDI